MNRRTRWHPKQWGFEEYLSVFFVLSVIVYGAIAFLVGSGLTRISTYISQHGLPWQ